MFHQLSAVHKNDLQGLFVYRSDGVPSGSGREREGGNRGSRRWRIRVIENGMENGSENDREWE